MAFDPVACENVQTVLDLTVNKLSELALLYSPDDSAHQLKNMLRNMVGIMTDRANTMKAFDRQLDSLRTEVANPEIQLEFLYCTARFLLGLTTAAEKALTEVAKERGLEGKRTGRKAGERNHACIRRLHKTRICSMQVPVTFSVIKIKTATCNIG